MWENTYFSNTCKWHQKNLLLTFVGIQMECLATYNYLASNCSLQHVISLTLMKTKNTQKTIPTLGKWGLWLTAIRLFLSLDAGILSEGEELDFLSVIWNWKTKTRCTLVWYSELWQETKIKEKQISEHCGDLSKKSTSFLEFVQRTNSSQVKVHRIKLQLKQWFLLISPADIHSINLLTDSFYIKY